MLDASVSVSVQSKFMSSADCSFFKCHESYIWIKIRAVHAVVNHAEYALILALIPHMRLYFPTPHKPHVEYALMFSKSEHHIRIILRLNEGNNGVKIAKGTTDPRVDLISQVLTQIWIKFNLQNVHKRQIQNLNQ